MGERKNRANPLLKRIPRELRADLGKYIVLFLFMSLMIGFVSGFLVADGSMIKAYNDSFTRYDVEDGHFSVSSKLTRRAVENIEKEDVRLYELFYKDKVMAGEKTIRIFKVRKDVNRADVMEGREPAGPGEIVLDRLFAENNGIRVGEKIELEGQELRVTGTVALSDYSSMFKNNGDMMFDASNFSIAEVTEEQYHAFDNSGRVYCYAWRWEDRNLTDDEQRRRSEDLMETVWENAVSDEGSVGAFLFGALLAGSPLEGDDEGDGGDSPLEDFVARQDNQAITFTGEDMGGDKVMFEWFLYIVTVVLAFAFAVTTRSAIEAEARTIGTLRATGYTRGELLGHYIALPVLVTFASAIVGNILGYTVFKYVVVDMYYHSYSLPSYVTIWSGEALLKTTLIPCALVIAVELLLVGRSLSLPPLQFLRRDMKRGRQSRAVRLPELSFQSRFRLRVILQNKSTFVILFSGLFLASVIFLFGTLFSPLLQNFKGIVQESKFCDYQYVLKSEVETESPQAEKFGLYALVNDSGETITVYGVEKDSAYVDRKQMRGVGKDRVMLSDGFMEKYGLEEGEEITLKEEFTSGTYTFRIAGTYEYPASMAVFMDMDQFREVFDLEDDAFSGYFSNERLTDIDDSDVATIITEKDLTVMANQLEDSMGKIFRLFTGFACVLFILMIYLLARLITERNAYSISMLKILGCTDREAGSLYNSATFIAVIISMILSGVLGIGLIRWIYYLMMKGFSGWLTFHVAPWGVPVLVITGIACYGVVSLALMRKIHKIPKTRALKDMD